MKYIVDNDLHIHSYLSRCSQHPMQTPDNILKYAQNNRLKTVCITDHFWDETVEGAYDIYPRLNYEYISAIKPLPKADDVRFLFGCEADVNKDLTIGISRERMELFDFVLISTTHFNSVGGAISEEDAANAKSRAAAWVKRVDFVLDQDLPFHKIGLSHLTCTLISPNRSEYLEVLRAIPQAEMERLFKKAAEVGVGIELNARDLKFTDEEADTVLRPYRIAKTYGCKFYFGSDAHRPDAFETSKQLFEGAVELLGLTEDDKFRI